VMKPICLHLQGVALLNMRLLKRLIEP
jgi:hypothetical protein